MNKKIVIPAAVVAILVVVGGVVWFTRDNSKNATETTASTETTQTQSDSSSPSFSPVATTDVSYEATLTASKDGKTFKATLKSDGKGNSEFEATQSGQEFKIILTGSAFYSCTGGTCYELDNRAAAAFDPANYQYTADDINNLKNNASYKGTAACGSATCDVWQVSKDGTDGTVYIDQSSKRIVKAEGVYDGDKGTLTFEYKPVTIDIPKNAQTLPQ